MRKDRLLKLAEMRPLYRTKIDAWNALEAHIANTAAREADPVAWEMERDGLHDVWRLAFRAIEAARDRALAKVAA